MTLNYSDKKWRLFTNEIVQEYDKIDNFLRHDGKTLRKPYLLTYKRGEITDESWKGYTGYFEEFNRQETNVRSKINLNYFFCFFSCHFVNDIFK